MIGKLSKELLTKLHLCIWHGSIAHGKTVKVVSLQKCYKCSTQRTASMHREWITPRLGENANGMMRHAVLPRFEELGLQYLAQASAYPLIILDECGRLEQRFPRFCAQVLELLEGETPVLGVVRQDVMGWLEEIRHHPKVQLVTVTEQNRNELPQQLAAYYRTLLK